MGDREVRVAVTDGEQSYSVLWVKLTPIEIFCGVGGMPYHSTYHGSGEIHLKEEKSTKEECPDVVIQSNQRIRTDSLANLGNCEGLFACLIPNTRDCLRTLKSLRKKKYDGIVYVDSRLFGEIITIQAWVSKPKNFFQKMPVPPGFRSIFEFGMDDSKSIWVIIDVEDS